MTKGKKKSSRKRAKQNGGGQPKDQIARILPISMGSTQAATERHRFVNRPFLFSKWVRSESETALSGVSSPAGLGSQFGAATLVFSASKLSANAQNWIQSYDAYRFRKLEIYANLIVSEKAANYTSDAPVIHYCYEDIDTDDSIDTSWIRLSDRSNIGRCVLRPSQPSVKVASFTPQPTFAASSGSSPTDLIGKEMDWVDAIDLALVWTGLRTFHTRVYQDPSGSAEPPMKYEIYYEARVSVDARCAI